MNSKQVNLLPSSIINVHKDIYSTKVNSNFYLAFNPFSYNRPVVFPKRYLPLFRKMKSKKSEIKDYLQTALRLNYSDSEAKEFLQLLVEHNIIATNNRPNTVCHNPRGSRLWRFTVWLHLTNDCNFRCKYCFVNKNPEKITLEDLKRSVDKIVETALEHKIKRITFILGGGEPLLQYDTIKQLSDYSIKLGKQHFLSIRLALITNGALLTEERAKYFKENNIVVGISVDGPERYHNQTRVYSDGSGTFKQVQRGLEIASKYNVLSNVSITATYDNIKGLPEFITYLLNLNPQIRIMLGLVKNNMMSAYHRKQFDTLIIRELKKTYKIIRDFYAKRDLDFSYLNFHKLLDAVFLYDPSGLHCGAGEYYLTITHKGKLKLCPSLADETAIDINSNEDLINLARKNNFLYPEQMRVDDIAKCRTCQWRYLCRGGCPSEKFNMGADLKNKPADYCKVYKSMIPYSIKLEGERLTNSLMQKITKDEK